MEKQLTTETRTEKLNRHRLKIREDLFLLFFILYSSSFIMVSFVFPDSKKDIAIKIPNYLGWCWFLLALGIGGYTASRIEPLIHSIRYKKPATKIILDLFILIIGVGSCCMVYYYYRQAE